MCSLDFERKNSFVGFVSLIFLLNSAYGSHVSRIECNSSLIQSCPAALYYTPTDISSNLQEAASLFNVDGSLVHRTDDGFLIMINCSCSANQNGFFKWQMDYLVQPGDSWDSIKLRFGSFLVENPRTDLIPSQIVPLDLLCGCSESGFVITYRIKSGDTLFIICSRFKADLNKTARLNELDNPGFIHGGDILFIPEPGLRNLLLEPDRKDAHAKKTPKSLVLICIGAICAASVIVMLVVVLWKKLNWSRARQAKALSQKPDCLDQSRDDRPNSKSGCLAESVESTASSLSSEKSTVFSYYEIRDATSNFSVSLKVGEGSYGSVYYGKLRGNDVAIKQMKSTKSKEFLSELNILCRVHHKNLIELIGYAAGGDSLFLVYEFAQNGALSNHLHNPTLRGYKPLPWVVRVQIAADAAKGLEYIHELTRPYYVHRDVKTSNILLDSNFHAKIGDFGLVKLLEHSPDVQTMASRIVGTFGYLAPEYVRDGLLTTKSDVYSFGVVLMELFTGQRALRKDESSETDQHNEHRSVVEYVLSALNDTDDPLTKLEKCVDPNLSCYHKDSLLQMALLSKDCVGDNWTTRPDMSRVVMCLSHILTNSKDWEELESKHLIG